MEVINQILQVDNNNQNISLAFPVGDTDVAYQKLLEMRTEMIESLRSIIGVL